MSEGQFGTQVFVLPNIDRQDFERSFSSEFPGGRFEFIDLVPDARNGRKMYELWVPVSRKDDVLPWFKRYCKALGFVTKVEPSSGFGWGHSG
jgi:hypothetical protein